MIRIYLATKIVSGIFLSVAQIEIRNLILRKLNIILSCTYSMIVPFYPKKVRNVVFYKIWYTAKHGILQSNNSGFSDEFEQQKGLLERIFVF